MDYQKLKKNIFTRFSTNDQGEIKAFRKDFEVWILTVIFQIIVDSQKFKLISTFFIDAGWYSLLEFKSQFCIPLI